MRAMLQARFGWAPLAGLLAVTLVSGCRNATKSVTPASNKQIRVGPQGGSLELIGSSGALRVDVPKGALTGDIALVARQLITPPEGALSAAFEVLPHGTQFSKPVSLVFGKLPETLLKNFPLTRLKVATRTEQGWELLPTTVQADGSVVGTTTHFSVFALVGECFVTGTGDDFQLVGCPGPSPRVRTSVVKDVAISGGQHSLFVGLLKEVTAGAVLVTVENLLPNTKYYLRHDRATVLDEETTDATGTLAFQQTRDAHHRTFLSTVHGSWALDASSCVAPAGDWNAATSTCRLLQDVPDADITVLQDGITVDCRNPTTGQLHRIGSAAARHDFGFSIFGLADVTIENCLVDNVGIGVDIFASTSTALHNVDVTSAAPSHGAIVFSSAATITQLRLATSAGITISSSSSVSASALEMEGPGQGLTIQSSSVSASNVYIRSPASRGVLVFHSPSTILDAVHVLGIPSSAAGGMAVALNSNVTIRGAVTSGGSTGININGTSLSAALTGSTTTCAQIGTWLDGNTSYRVSRNNFFGNSLNQVYRSGSLDAGTLELSDTDPSSATYQQGNFWGHACPGPLFTGGVDAPGGIGAIDSFPFGGRSAWEVAGNGPGCPISSTPSGPGISSPVEGGVVRTRTPTIYGTGTPGGSVEVLSQGQLVGSGTVDSCGVYAIQPTTPFAVGPQAITARITVQGSVSALSAARQFVVEPATTTLATPVITEPRNGDLVATSTPTVSGTALPGATVEVLADGQSRGFAPVATSGTFALTLAAPLSEGPHTITARASLGGASSDRSAAVSIVVDTTRPNAPTITFPTTGFSVVDGMVPVTGLAEPNSTVVLHDGENALLAVGSSTDGGFEAPLQLSSGTHSLSAIAIDAAGNESASSATVLVSVEAAASTSAAMLTGSEGIIEVMAVSDSPDPFVPADGEVSQIRATLEIAAGNRPKKASAGSIVRTTRSIYDARTATLVTTVTTEEAVPFSKKRNGSVPMTVEAGWDGRTPGGGIAPDGPYTSLTSITLLGPIRPERPPTTPGCSTLGSIGGRCVDDRINQFRTVELLRSTRFTPLPTPKSTCRTTLEQCNGLDDNCNGEIDEGPACSIVLACPCVRLAPEVACAGGETGMVPDGCGLTIDCGGRP